MPTLFAQPRDPGVTGFQFESAAEFWARARELRGASRDKVADFEVRFVDGQLLDAELFKAIGGGRADLAAYFEAVRSWTVDQKVRAIITVGQVGVGFPLDEAEADMLDLDLHLVDSLRDLARQFVEDGVFGEIPEEIANYIDYDAIARDLEKTYCMITVAGVSCAFSSGSCEIPQRAASAR